MNSNFLTINFYAFAIIFWFSFYIGDIVVLFIVGEIAENAMMYFYFHTIVLKFCQQSRFEFIFTRLGKYWWKKQTDENNYVANENIVLSIATNHEWNSSKLYSMYWNWSDCNQMMGTVQTFQFICYISPLSCIFSLSHIKWDSLFLFIVQIW